MRIWIISALGALALCAAAVPGVQAAPATGQTAIGSSQVGGSALQEARYVVRCNRVRVWRNTPQGRRPVLVRRCHRHYY